MKKLLLFALVLKMSSPLLSQENKLNTFFLISSETKVLLRWTLETGITCTGITIYRSTDSLNYTEVGHIPGVCGSYSSPQSYTFSDLNPVKNENSFYRLKLGTIGYSQTISLKDVYIKKGAYEIRPNPASDRTQIYFNNEKKEIHTISLKTLKGVALLSLESSDNYFDVDLQNIPSAQYIFSITSKDNQVIAVGKLTVVPK